MATRNTPSGNQLASQPDSQPASQLATFQPVSQPDTHQATSQTANQPGNQPASHLPAFKLASETPDLMSASQPLCFRIIFIQWKTVSIQNILHTFNGSSYFQLPATFKYWNILISSRFFGNMMLYLSHDVKFLENMRLFSEPGCGIRGGGLKSWFCTPKLE